MHSELQSVLGATDVFWNRWHFEYYLNLPATTTGFVAKVWHISRNKVKTQMSPLQGLCLLMLSGRS